jgi:hypothetical protein
MTESPGSAAVKTGVSAWNVMHTASKILMLA